MSEEIDKKLDDNNPDKKKPEQNPVNGNTEFTPYETIPPAPNTFPEPRILEAVVDPKEKPKEGPTPFSFTTPQAVHADMGKPTKGDVAQMEQTASKKQSLADLDAAIARDEKREKEYTYDDYKDTAEMFIEGWEAAITLVCRFISKDTSDSAYEFSKDKKERLVYQATKVSRKRNWVMPVEYMFFGTLIPATATIVLKATDKRKEYVKKLDSMPANSTTETIKGGPNKGLIKRRGPGRPTK